MIIRSIRKTQKRQIQHWYIAGADGGTSSLFSFSVFPVDFLQGLGTSNNPFPGSSSGELQFSVFFIAKYIFGVLFCIFDLQYWNIIQVILTVHFLVVKKAYFNIFVHKQVVKSQETVHFPVSLFLPTARFLAQRLVPIHSVVLEELILLTHISPEHYHFLGDDT